MSRSVDVAKRQAWSERLRRFAQGKWTVAAFCQRERVSVPSFYQWRRKLGGTNGSGMARRGERPGFVPLRIIPAAVVEMRLPNGVQLSLPAGDATMLAAAIAAAGRITSAPGREDEAC